MFLSRIHSRSFWKLSVLVVLILTVLACSEGASPTRVTQDDTPVAETVPVQTESVEIKPTSTTEPTPSVTPTPAPVTVVKVTAGSVNLRGGPGTNYSIVGNAKKDDALSVYGKNEAGEWLLISMEKPTWVHASLVQLESDLASLPVIDPIEVTLLSENTPEARSTDPVETAPQLEPTEADPTALAGDENIQVLQVSTYRASDGGLVAYGEVKNTGAAVLKSIKVSLTLYDAEGKLLDTDSGYVELPWGFNLWNTGVLYAGQKAPFSILFDNPGNWSSYKVAIEYRQASQSDYDDHFNQFQVLNDTGRPINDLLYNYQVTGEIKNTGSATTGNVWIVVTLYDSQGKVVGKDLAMTEVESTFPGESIPFKVQVYARGQVASYSLIYDAITP